MRKNSRYIRKITELKKSLNDRGAGLPMVLVGVGLVAILVSVLMAISLLNFQMKVTEKGAKDNFYSAEKVLDQIHAGLQLEVSQAAEAAYTRSIETYIQDDEAGRIRDFQMTYLNTLRESLKGATLGSYNLGVAAGVEPDATTGVYQNGLASYLDKNLARKLKEGSVKLYAQNDKNELYEPGNAIVLKNLVVEYLEDTGYYTTIRTDIRIGIPDIALKQTAILPELFEYSLVASDSVNISRGSAYIKNNVYAGNKGIFVTSSGKLEMTDSQYVSTTGTLTVDNTSSAYIAPETLWLENIAIMGSPASPSGTGGGSAALGSAKLDLKTNTYVKDDMTVTGKNSQITLRGNYYGYGVASGEVDPAKSSAIVMNSTNATLDMSRLESLTLWGNAYINSSANFATNVDGTSSQTSAKDSVLLGNSLALKTDQIVFLAPPEWLKDNSGNIINRNPLTKEEYTQWNKSLSVSTDATTKYGINSKSLTTLFKKYNDTTLCYVYLKMDAANAANYYKDYLTTFNERLNEYAKKYQNTIKMKDNTSRINGEGNIVSYDSAKGLTIVNATLPTAANRASLLSRRNEIQMIHEALTAKLTTQLSSVSDAEKTKNPYTNLILTDAVNALTGTVKYEMRNGINAIVINNAGKGAYTVDQFADKTKLVIASGDVYVKGNFSGLIIANGKINIENQTAARINADKQTVLELLQVTQGEKSLIETFFKDGDRYALKPDDGSSASGSTGIDLGGVIGYENWAKN